MKTPTLISLVAGLVAAAIALSAWVKATRQPEDGGPGPTTIVLLAKAEIPYAAAITEEMLSAVPFKGAQSPIAETFATTEELVGRVTSARIVAGAPITGPMLAPPGTPAGPDRQIPDGFRLVPVSIKAGSARHLDPGSHVDVFGGKDRGLLVQNVEVLAVGDRREGMESTPEDKAAKSVALLVRADNAPKLGAVSGTVQLWLRSNTDTRIFEDPKPAPSKSVVGPVQPKAAKPVAPSQEATAERPLPAKRKVKVYNGYEEKGFKEPEYELPFVDEAQQQDSD